MRSKINTTILLIILSFGIVYAQNLNKPKLDSLFDILAEKNKAERELKGDEVLGNLFGYSIDSFCLFLGISVVGFYRLKSVSLFSCFWFFFLFDFRL